MTARQLEWMAVRAVASDNLVEEETRRDIASFRIPGRGCHADGSPLAATSGHMSKRQKCTCGRWDHGERVA